MTGSRRDAGTIAISIGLVALGAFALQQSTTILADGGYSVVGPRFAPMLVGAGLVLVGALLAWQAFAGGWKNMPPPPAESAHAPSFLWIAGGLAVHMAIIGHVGFTLASTLLFAAVARGFGSRRTLHDLVVGAILAIAVFLFFTRVLGLSLPASPLRVV